MRRTHRFDDALARDNVIFVDRNFRHTMARNGINNGHDLDTTLNYFSDNAQLFQRQRAYSHFRRKVSTKFEIETHPSASLSTRTAPNVLPVRGLYMNVSFSFIPFGTTWSHKACECAHEHAYCYRQQGVI